MRTLYSFEGLGRELINAYLPTYFQNLNVGQGMNDVPETFSSILVQSVCDEIIFELVRVHSLQLCHSSTSSHLISLFFPNMKLWTQ